MKTLLFVYIRWCYKYTLSMGRMRGVWSRSGFGAGRRLHVCTARTCVRGVLRDVHVRVRGTFFVDANLPSTDVLFGSRESVRVRGIGC